MKDNLRLLPGPATCRCAGCVGLATRYAADPDLLASYKKRLLQRNWAGVTDDVERLYQISHVRWARAALESGRRLARSNPGNPQEHLRRERFAAVGEAPATKVEEMGCPHPEPHPPQGQLALVMVLERSR